MFCVFRECLGDLTTEGLRGKGKGGKKRESNGNARTGERM